MEFLQVPELDAADLARLNAEMQLIDTQRRLLELQAGVLERERVEIFKRLNLPLDGSVGVVLTSGQVPRGTLFHTATKTPIMRPPPAPVPDATEARPDLPAEVPAEHC